jgi:hypothetical protein
MHLHYEMDMNLWEPELECFDVDVSPKGLCVKVLVPTVLLLRSNEIFRR